MIVKHWWLDSMSRPTVLVWRRRYQRSQLHLVVQHYLKTCFVKRYGNRICALINVSTQMIVMRVHLDSMLPVIAYHYLCDLDYLFISCIHHIYSFIYASTGRVRCYGRYFDSNYIRTCGATGKVHTFTKIIEKNINSEYPIYTFTVHIFIQWKLCLTF